MSAPKSRTERSESRSSNPLPDTFSHKSQPVLKITFPFPGDGNIYRFDLIVENLSPSYNRFFAFTYETMELKSTSGQQGGHIAHRIRSINFGSISGGMAIGVSCHATHGLPIHHSADSCSCFMVPVCEKRTSVSASEKSICSLTP